MPKIQSNKKGNSFITIPKDIMIFKGWNKSDELSFIIEADKVCLSKNVPALQ